MKNKIIISIVITCILIVILSFTCFASQDLHFIPSGTSVTMGDYMSAYPYDSSLPVPDIRYLEGMTDTGDVLIIITINAQYLETFARNNNLTLPNDNTISYPCIRQFNIDISSIDYGTFSNINDFESVCRQILTSLSNNGNEDLQNQITALNNQITALNTRIQELENEIIDKDEQIERWHDLYVSYLNSYNDALQDIEELENDLEEKNNDYNLLYQRFISAENQIVSLNAEIIRLEQELENALNNATSYQDGYNQALEDYDIFNSGLASIFSAPMYIVNSIFGFEIFGFNFFTVIQFILSLVLIIWLFEKMR